MIPSDTTTPASAGGRGSAQDPALKPENLLAIADFIEGKVSLSGTRENIARIADQLRAQARTVPPAAAPVTGDRETAGVERVTAAQIGLAGDEQERLAFNLCGEFGSDYVQSKRDFAYAVIAEYQAIVVARATPPSGGGDHAAPEAGGGALSLDGLDAAEASYDAHADRHGHPRCDPTALQDAIDDYLTVAATARPGGTSSSAGAGTPADATTLGAQGEPASSAPLTARPAGAEGSAEVSCKENGGSAATTDASCKAAEPVINGDLLDDMRDVQGVIETMGCYFPEGSMGAADRDLALELLVKHFPALAPTRDASDGEGADHAG